MCEKAVGRPPPGLPLWGAEWGRKGKPPETKRQTEMTETREEGSRSGRTEQEEAAQTQSWAFLGQDSNSRGSNASREQRAPGLGERGISSSSAWQVLKALAPQLPHSRAGPCPPPQRPAQPSALPLGLGQQAGPGVGRLRCRAVLPRGLWAPAARGGAGGD